MSNIVMNPPAHVHELLEAKVLSEAQWALFQLADAAVADGRQVVLHAGASRFGANTLALDAAFPGVIFATLPDGSQALVEWSTLTAVTCEDGFVGI